MRTALLSLWKYRRFLQPCSHPLVSQENKPLPFSPISATLNLLLLCTDTKNGSAAFSATEPLGFKVIFIKQRRLEKLRKTDTQSLAKLVNHPELHGIIGTIHYISNG